MAIQQRLFPQHTYNTVVTDVKMALHEAVRNSTLSREQALDRVNQLAHAFGVKLVKGNGNNLTMDTWDKWLNPSDESRVPSIKALPVICAALGTMEPLRPIVEICGGQLIDEKDARLLEWAKAYRRAKMARTQMKKLEEEF